jgi:hypothetical protein
MPRKPSGSGVAFRAHLLSRLNFSLVSKTGPPCRGRALGEEGALFGVPLLKMRVALRGVVVRVLRSLLVRRNGAGGVNGAIGIR